MKRISNRIAGCLLAGSVLLAAQSAWADEKDSQALGEETRSWLQLQRSGEAASDTQRPMSGDVAQRTYQRYVETHSYSIPESFVDEQQSFVED